MMVSLFSGGCPSWMVAGILETSQEWLCERTASALRLVSLRACLGRAAARAAMPLPTENRHTEPLFLR
jgi:hypothetical protein